MAGPARRSTSLTLAGTTARADNVLLLASRLDGDVLAQKLERELANGNTSLASLASCHDEQRDGRQGRPPLHRLDRARAHASGCQRT